jgi:hypothetical protein
MGKLAEEDLPDIISTLILDNFEDGRLNLHKDILI